MCSGDNSFYYESGIEGQSLLQRHLLQANNEEVAQDDDTVTDEG